MNVIRLLSKTSPLSRWTGLAASLLLVLLGFVPGWFAGKNLFSADTAATANVERREGGFRFTNPLLDCEINDNPVTFTELKPFREEVAELIGKRTKGSAGTRVSVYFRDLMNGPWFGINEMERFSTADVARLPIIIACLKQTEQDGGFLKKQVLNTLPEHVGAHQSLAPGARMLADRGYTVEDLIRRTITFSDDKAAHLLIRTVDEAILVKTFQDVGVLTPERGLHYDTVPVKMYASFFRILFNASVLDKKRSHQTLAYMTYGNDHAGIHAGVPDYVLVSHLSGSHGDPDEQAVEQVHDCGIVYYPGHPYLLCVMTRGTDPAKQHDLIGEISKTVYREVDGQMNGAGGGKR